MKNKYFVAKDLNEFSVIFEDWSKEAGNHYSTKRSGFTTEAEAQEFADSLNK